MTRVKKKNNDEKKIEFCLAQSGLSRAIFLGTKKKKKKKKKNITSFVVRVWFYQYLNQTRKVSDLIDVCIIINPLSAEIGFGHSYYRIFY